MTPQRQPQLRPPEHERAFPATARRASYRSFRRSDWIALRHSALNVQQDAGFVRTVRPAEGDASRVWAWPGLVALAQYRAVGAVESNVWMDDYDGDDDGDASADVLPRTCHRTG